MHGEDTTNENHEQLKNNHDEQKIPSRGYNEAKIVHIMCVELAGSHISAVYVHRGRDEKFGSSLVRHPWRVRC